ncbi:hypothetical protein ACFL4Q_05085 [candidate division KSB1 bacterium]
MNLYPLTMDALPDVPSPWTAANGIEVVTAFTMDKKYALMCVTVENGAPMNYNQNQWGKGRQLACDSLDFPTLAATGLHSEPELERTGTITGKPVGQITEIGRPGQWSREGFMSHDEDIISVLKGDNRMVKTLGMTHPELAKPLFNVFNLILEHLECYRNGIKPFEDIEYILYNGKKIFLKWGGSKGWQNSIFNDEILGYYQIEMRRELEQKEIDFLREKYPDLDEEHFAELIHLLSYVHTGEMVPYYIMRYGFYEGHTGYRADPLAVACIFGLKNLEEIEIAFSGDLYAALKTHFTSK